MLNFIIMLLACSCIFSSCSQPLKKEEQPPIQTQSQFEPLSAEAAKHILSKYTPKQLGLSHEIDAYEFIISSSPFTVNAADCSEVTAILSHEQENGEKNSFYISENSSNIWIFDPLLKEYISIDSYAYPLNPEESSPKSVIEAALKIYQYFELYTLDVDSSQTITEKMPGTDFTYTWYRVAEQRLNTLEKLTAELQKYFSEEIIAELMSKNIYLTGADGYLYTLDGARGSNIFIEDVFYELVNKGENAYTYQAVVTYSADALEPENPASYTYVCEKINDIWVFTSFPYFY